MSACLAALLRDACAVHRGRRAMLQQQRLAVCTPACSESSLRACRCCSLMCITLGTQDGQAAARGRLQLLHVRQPLARVHAPPAAHARDACERAAGDAQHALVAALLQLPAGGDTRRHAAAVPRLVYAAAAQRAGAPADGAGRRRADTASGVAAAAAVMREARLAAAVRTMPACERGVIYPSQADCNQVLRASIPCAGRHANTRQQRGPSRSFAGGPHLTLCWAEHVCSACHPETWRNTVQPVRTCLSGTCGCICNIQVHSA